LASLSYLGVPAIKHNIYKALRYERTRKSAEVKMGAVCAAVQLGEDHGRKVVAVKPR
jgi:hypothetical protein